MKFISRCFSFVLFTVLLHQVIFAQLTANRAGKVDLSFGNNGSVFLTVPGREYVSNGELVKTTDGKLLILSNTWSSGRVFPTIHRLEENGMPDPSFGQNGIRLISAFDNFIGMSLAVQKDGKILISGSSSQTVSGTWVVDSVLMRLNPDGTPDVTFGNGSIVTQDLSSTTETSHDRYAAVAVRPDGKYFLAGISDKFSSAGRTKRYVTAAQFNPNGTLDTTFGTGGIALFEVGSGETSSYFSTSLRLRTLKNGRFAVVVSERVYESETSSNYEFFTSVLRFDQNGLDNTFSGDGRAIFGTGPFMGNVGGFDEDRFGRIVVASNDDKLRRLNDDGTPDSTFGENGTLSIEPVWGKTDLAIAANGKINVVGVGRDALAGPPQQVFGIVRRYNADGSPDIGFGRMGKRSVLVGSDYTQFDRVTIDNGESLLLLGTRTVGSNLYGNFILRINGSRKMPVTD